MKTLALDGALAGFSAAVTIDGRLAAVDDSAGDAALERGLVAVQAVLERAGGKAHLDRIAVGIGPGRFTGLRIAVGYAKALALAWNLPLVAVSSFDLLEDASVAAARLAVVVGRPGVISARYRGPEGEQRASGRLASVLASVLPQDLRRIQVAGASEDVRAALAERGIIVTCISPPAEPAAATIARISERLAPEMSPHALRPDYGEAPAAVPPARGTPAAR